MFGFVLGL